MIKVELKSDNTYIGREYDTYGDADNWGEESGTLVVYRGNQAMAEYPAGEWRRVFREDQTVDPSAAHAGRI